jgi:hypothetical protein
VPIAFETIHTNIRPTYQTMYMPGTSLLLATGKAVGLPWLSVVLVTGLFCAAVYWMASGWLPRGYAFAAAVAAIVITHDLQWWFDNYFAIGLTALAGALVLGSLPRILTRQTMAATWPLGAGLVILILTRPYEGFMLTFPAVMVLLWSLKSMPPRRLVRLAAAPTAMLVCAFAWLFYYNWRGTGHPLLFPYMLNYEAYHITGAFLWSRPKAIPTYDLAMLQRFYTQAELPQYDLVIHHPWAYLARKIAVYYSVFLFGFGGLLALGLLRLLRERSGLLLAPALAFGGFVLQVVLMAWAPFPQYAGPAAATLFLLVAFGMQAVRSLDGPRLARLRLSGLRLTRGLVLAEFLVAVNVFALHYEHRHVPLQPQYVSIDRNRVEREVLAHPGRHLCLVRYTPGHDGWQEWVFNGADPASERLVWARSLDPETDRKVIAAFPGRTVWLVKPDRAGDMLKPYPPNEPWPFP